LSFKSQLVSECSKCPNLRTLRLGCLLRPRKASLWTQLSPLRSSSANSGQPTAITDKSSWIGQSFRLKYCSLLKLRPSNSLKFSPSKRTYSIESCCRFETWLKFSNPFFIGIYFLGYFGTFFKIISNYMQLL
jgi:hypothetical protein